MRSNRFCSSFNLIQRPIFIWSYKYFYNLDPFRNHTVVQFGIASVELVDLIEMVWHFQIRSKKSWNIIKTDWEISWKEYKAINQINNLWKFWLRILLGKSISEMIWGISPNRKIQLLKGQIDFNGNLLVSGLLWSAYHCHRILLNNCNFSTMFNWEMEQRITGEIISAFINKERAPR